MANINFQINDEYLNDILDAFSGLFPIPVVENPSYEEGSNEPKLVPEYTKAQWAKLKIKEYIVKTVARYKQKEAIKAVPFVLEDDKID